MLQFGEELKKKEGGKDDSFRNKTNSSSQITMGRLKKLVAGLE